MRHILTFWCLLKPRACMWDFSCRLRRWFHEIFILAGVLLRWICWFSACRVNLDGWSKFQMREQKTTASASSANDGMRENGRRKKDRHGIIAVGEKWETTDRYNAFYALKILWPWLLLSSTSPFLLPKKRISSAIFFLGIFPFFGSLNEYVR